MRSSLFRMLPVLLAGVLAAACGDAPTDPPAGQTAALGFSLNVSSTDVRLLVVDVTAPDINQPLVYNVEVVNGIASGRLDVPPGPARTIRVRAYDHLRTQTHEGSAVMDVRPGANQAVNVRLMPAAGHVPLSVGFGSVVVSVRAVDAPNTPTGEYTLGTSMRFEATVTTAEGAPVPGAVVRWASLNPGVASVDQNGYVTTSNAGATEIAATYNGHGASIAVNVTERTDFYAPSLTAITFDPGSVAVVAGSPKQVRMTFRASDDQSGINAFSVEVRGVTRPSTGWTCLAYPTGTPGEHACTLSVSAAMAPDDYVVTQVYMTDHAGNPVLYLRSDLAAMGINPRLTVTQG